MVRWRGAFDKGELSTSENRLLLLASLRGMLAYREYSTDTINRKGLMATGLGWVHGHFFNLRKKYREMDKVPQN